MGGSGWEACGSRVGGDGAGVPRGKGAGVGGGRGRGEGDIPVGTLPPPLLQSEDQEEIQEAVRTCSRLFGALLERGELFVGQLPSEEMVMTGEPWRALGLLFSFRGSEGGFVTVG